MAAVFTDLYCDVTLARAGIQVAIESLEQLPRAAPLTTGTAAATDRDRAFRVRVKSRSELPHGPGHCSPPAAVLSPSLVATRTLWGVTNQVVTVRDRGRAARQSPGLARRMRTNTPI